MTQSIESMIEVLQAYQAGKKIEYFCTDDCTWKPIVGFDTTEYRIAPEQKKKVKYLCWDNDGYLHFVAEGIPVSVDWIRVPSEDKEILI